MNSSKFLIFLVLFLVGGWYFGDFSVFRSTQVAVFTEENLVTVSTKDTYFEYDIDSDEYEYDYRVIQVNPSHKSSSAMGAAFEIAVVTDADYEEFETLQAQGTCPANFLNSRAEMFLVIPDSTETKIAIDRKKYQTGDNFSLSGKPLEINYVEHKGVALEKFELKNAQLLLATGVS